ncbi:MAG: electron transport complex subunit RsxG [Betaproteobacteria bacterium]
MSHAKPFTATKMATRTAIILFLFTIAFTAALAGVYQVTKPAIDAYAVMKKMRSIGEVLPPESYDNDLLNDTLELPATPALGLDDVSTVYRGRKGGQPAALVLETVATDGYSGKIRMLIGVQADGTLTGVRVTEHRETPGLGDYIEPQKDKNKDHPWIKQFDGLSLEKRPDRDWKVKKDGGRFDSIAGATISPRAVIKAVNKTLNYVAAHRVELYAAK